MTLCYVLPEYKKDIDSHLFHIYELLEEAGKEIPIFLFVEHPKDEPQIDNMEGVYAQKFSVPPLNLIERFIVFTFLRLKGYDKFYIHYSYFSAVIASLIARLSNGTTFYWSCGLKQDFPFPFTKPFRKVFDEGMFLLTLKSIDYLVTGNKTMAEYHTERFGVDPDKIKVLPNWVNLERFNPDRYNEEAVKEELGLPEDRKIILFVHDLSRRKGPQHLAEIAENVVKEVPDSLFVIVGDGPYRKKLLEDIKTHDLEDKFRVVEKVPNSEVPKYFSIADVFLMPSEDEGFPRVLLESMAMRIPFVATDVGGVRDIVTKNQSRHILDKSEVKNLDSNLIEILLNEEEAEKLNVEGFNQVEQFRKRKIVIEFTKIMEGDR